MFEIKPLKVAAEDGKGKVDDYWKPSTGLLGDPKFMDKLLEYDKDHISPEVIKKIRNYVSNPEFDVKVIEKQSKAATGLCKWVRAMEVYDRVAKVVEPKRIALKEAEDSLSTMMAELAEKQSALKAITDKIAQLQAQFKEANDEKISLANQVDMCEKKLAH